MAVDAQNPPKPGTRKITVGALSGAVVTILVHVFSQLQVPLSAEVTAAMGSIVTAILTYMTTETYT